MPQAKKPRLRSAKTLTPRAFAAALRSKSASTVHYALIDGCRCLDPDIVLPRALERIEHRSKQIQWAALFAIEFLGPELVRELDHDWEFVHRLNTIAWKSPHEDVRHAAVQVFLRLVGVLHWRVEQQANATVRKRKGRKRNAASST